MVNDEVMDATIHVLIEEAKERCRKRREGYPESEVDPRTTKEKIDDLNPRLYDYAKSKFPQMDDELIYQNALDILFHMEQGGMVDGHLLGLVLNRHTGEITLRMLVRE